MDRKMQLAYGFITLALIIAIVVPINLAKTYNDQITALQTQIEDFEAQIEALKVDGYNYVMEKDKDYLSYGNTTYIEIIEVGEYGSCYIKVGVKDKYILRLDNFNKTEILTILEAQDFHDELIEGHIAITVNKNEQGNYFSFSKYKSTKLLSGVDYFGTSWDSLPNNLGYFPESFTDDEITIIVQYMDDFFKSL